ncbi:MAG: S-layer homology domain-containing protein, partial [Acidimicrobiaceae bacterium]|nr:S-layer homology domain-containing protein [Acidimicrobiaceae bacterium]
TVSEAVTFTTDNWGTAQTFTVTGTNTGTSEITHTATSNDPNYTLPTIGTVTATTTGTDVEEAGFVDVDPSNSHAASINAVFAAGITTGCSQNPLSYCPNNPVTRAQMATFLTRALKLDDTTEAGFTDVDPSNNHTASINAVFAAGITTGCSQNPLSYCPNQPVTRAQMATFLTRALKLSTPTQS